MRASSCIILALLQVLDQTALPNAFSHVGLVQHNHQQQRQRTTASSNIFTTCHRGPSLTRQFSSQWDEDEAEEVTTARTSFEDAGESLQKEDDNERMGQMGEFDANPAVR
jgi:hypothetical protein